MVSERSDEKLLELVEHLKLSSSFDPSIAQKTGKPTKFTGKSFVNCLTKDSVHASSPDEAKEILGDLLACGYLLKSSGTSEAASPLKDKVHYRFNDEMISTNHRRASASPRLVRLSTSSSPPSLSTLSSKEEIPEKYYFLPLKHFALTFVSINLYHYTSLHYPHDTVTRVFITFILASASVALLNLDFGGSMKR